MMSLVHCNVWSSARSSSLCDCIHHARLYSFVPFSVRSASIATSVSNGDTLRDGSFRAPLI